MSIDLNIGFRTKPADLDEVLTEKGFALQHKMSPEGENAVAMRSYVHHEPGRSARGVHVVYHDGVYEDSIETWKPFVSKPEEIVATGSVSTYMGRNEHDLDTQWAIARFLRDHYNAVLADPQTGKLVED